MDLDNNEIKVKKNLSSNLVKNRSSSIISDSQGEEDFMNLLSQVVFHNFDKSIMEERRSLSLNSGSETSFSDISIDLEDDLFNSFQEILTKYNVTASEFINDMLYDLMLQLKYKDVSNNLEVIDSVYMVHKVDDLIESNKDYLVIDYKTQDKVVFIANKDSINIYNSFKDIS